ncbi:hypothetical protein UFOVP691_26 [uncultured Caudovirales phage]|uniref:Uncharacterized protein n=1 Tax=uncultured Caudovirales phage TaxID=2100421 RepID=A0A6J5NEY6_9CAUD|nr:hypothetical protein UFOVP691_26 [uncultured Caudovirales phage]
MQQMELFPDGQFGRMSQAHLTPTEVLTLEKCWTQWQKQGRWSLSGNCWTANTLASPKRDGEYSLSLDLFLTPQTQVPPKYFLSIKALTGIYTREIKSVSTKRTEGSTNLPLESHHLSRQTWLSVLLQKYLNQEL